MIISVGLFRMHLHTSVYVDVTEKFALLNVLLIRPSQSFPLSNHLTGKVLLENYTFFSIKHTPFKGLKFSSSRRTAGVLGINRKVATYL